MEIDCQICRSDFVGIKPWLWTLSSQKLRPGNACLYLCRLLLSLSFLIRNIEKMQEQRLRLLKKKISIVL
jgi:hypothetical protein